MDRRSMLQWSAVGLGAMGVSACGGNKYINDESAGGATHAESTASMVASGPVHRWTLAAVVPTNFEIWGPGIQRFADTLRLISGGRLDVTVKGVGEVVPGMQIFDAVKDGDVEMGHAASYYWDGKADGLQAAVYFTTVPFGMSAEGAYAWLHHGGGNELWQELYAPFTIMPMPMGATGRQAGGWFRKPIATLADLQGLTMRMPGLGGKVLSAAGGNAQSVPPAEIYLALERGRIDATEWVGPYHDYMRGFHEVAPYYYVGGWHEPGSILELSINKRKWDELTPELQRCVRIAAADADSWIFHQWQTKDAEYYDKLLAMPSITVAPFPKAIADELRPYADRLKADIAATSPVAKRIVASYDAFQKRFEGYQRACGQLAVGS